MNYIFYLKQQAISFTFVSLGIIISYGITCKLGWREVIVLTPECVLSIVSYSLSFIFIGPFVCQWWQDTKHR